jgi:hypothetical protein
LRPGLSAALLSVALDSIPVHIDLVAREPQGRTATSSFTDFTPLTLRAMAFSSFFSLTLLAMPDSMTTPFIVSLLIDAASTALL